MGMREDRVGVGGRWMPVAAVLAGLAAITAALPSPGVGSAQADATLKVVVHVNFPTVTRTKAGLKNVENMLKAAGDDGLKADIEVVCHGEGIRLVEKARTELAAEVAALADQGVRFLGCQNTMRAAIAPGRRPAPRRRHRPLRRLRDRPEAAGRLRLFQALIASRRPPPVPLTLFLHRNTVESWPTIIGFLGREAHETAEGWSELGLAGAGGRADRLGGAVPLDLARHGRTDLNERFVRGVAPPGRGGVRVTDPGVRRNASRLPAR